MQVLLRALRDFNVGKIGADDTSIFMGLLNDLFPKTVEHVPRAVDVNFETKVRANQGVAAGIVQLLPPPPVLP
jgi:dynein heavy chain